MNYDNYTLIQNPTSVQCKIPLLSCAGSCVQGPVTDLLCMIPLHDPLQDLTDETNDRSQTIRILRDAEGSPKVSQYYRQDFTKVINN